MVVRYLCKLLNGFINGKDILSICSILLTKKALHKEKTCNKRKFFTKNNFIVKNTISCNKKNEYAFLKFFYTFGFEIFLGVFVIFTQQEGYCNSYRIVKLA